MLFIDLIYWFNLTFFITIFWIIFKYIRKIPFFYYFTLFWCKAGYFTPFNICF